MGFFSSVGKFFKKALPVVAPMASFAIPGVGGLLGSAISGIGSKVFGGDQPVELKGDGSLGDSGQSWWSGVGNAVGGLLNQDWSGVAAGGLAYQGARETNAAAAHQAQVNRDFQSAQAQRQMDFQASQATQAMDFAGDQSQAQMDFQERMSNTAQQRGAADMKAAGFNPMLSFMKGGASAPAGSSASGSMGSGASGHGAQADVVNALGQAVNTAMSAQKMGAEIANARETNRLIQAQTRSTDAQTLESATRLPKLHADTVVSQVTASKLNEEVEQVKATTEKLKDERQLLIDKARNERLTSEEKSYYLLHIQQYDRAIKEAQSKLMGYAVPGARNVAGAQDSWWMREVSPYLPDVLRGASSAAGFSRMMK